MLTAYVDPLAIAKVPSKYPPAPPPPPEIAPVAEEPPAPPPPTARISASINPIEAILNALGITFSPSDALIVNVYVVFVVIFGSVPEIKPEEEFNVTPEGKDEPLASEYVIVESESVAVAETDIDTCSVNVPSDPAVVVHTGEALIYKASGIIPNKLEGFVTFIS